MMKIIGDYKLIKLLGKGSFGETYLTQKGNDPILLATKVLERKKMEKVSTKKYLDNEIKILKQLHHPHIVRFENFLASNSNYYLIMEYCNGGDLTGCLQKYKNLYHESTFSIDIVQYLMRQIVDAMKYIHSLKIIHRDIKLDNILLSFNNEQDKKNLNLLSASIKIIDFGLATKLEGLNLAYSVLGSPINMDPLILKKFDKAGGYKVLEGYNEKADIWSLGTVFYQLLTGEVLFLSHSMKELMKKVEEGNYVIPINKNFSKEAVSFLNCMLQYKPEDRLSINELEQHDFIVKNVNEFTQADFKQIFNKLDNKGLRINVKENKTIARIFNASGDYNENNYNYNKNNNQINNNNKVKPVMKRYIKIPSEQGYVSNGNIYQLNTESNTSNRRASMPNSNEIKKIPININKNMNHNRFTEGYISPGKNHNVKYEINKFEKEMKENEKRENEINIKKLNEKKEEDNQIKKKELMNSWDKGTNDAKKYINGLLTEYKAAADYFNKNGLKQQEEDAIQKLIQTQKIVNQFDKGYLAYFETLPKPITPEYIYNCSVEKRNSIFQIIISNYSKETKELEDNMKQEILNYKKLDTQSFSKIKDQVMTKLKSQKDKVDKLKKIIKLLEYRYNNIWTPAPEYSEELARESIHKMSFEDFSYKLVIQTTKVNYNGSNLVFKFSMHINSNKNLYGEVNISSQGDNEEDIIWDLSQNEYNNISNYCILIKAYSNKLYHSSQKINISNLKNDKEMNINFPIFSQRQSSETIINFNIKLLNNDINKQTSTGQKKIINIKKTYPPFDGKSPDTNEIPSLFIDVK